MKECLNVQRRKETAQRECHQTPPGTLSWEKFYQEKDYGGRRQSEQKQQFERPLLRMSVKKFQGRSHVVCTWCSCAFHLYWIVKTMFSHGLSEFPIDFPLFYFADLKFLHYTLCFLSISVWSVCFLLCFLWIFFDLCCFLCSPLSAGACWHSMLYASVRFHL